MALQSLGYCIWTLADRTVLSSLLTLFGTYFNINITQFVYLVAGIGCWSVDIIAAVICQCR